VQPQSETGRRRDWELPGAFPVAPGVHRIPLPLPGDGLRAVNVYAVQDGARLMMIDAGWALTESRRLLEAALALIGQDLGGISRFLVTHAHRDHYSQAIAIRKVLGTRVALGIGEEPTIRAIQEAAHGQLPPPLLSRIRAAGAGPLADVLASAASAAEPAELEQWAGPDEWLHGGTAIELAGRTLDIIATPGHTRGHVVFRDAAAGLLFAGDHILPHITPSIGFEPVPTSRSLSDYLASLDLIAGLADTMMLPAHGPVQPGTTARIAELAGHHRRRLAATQAAVRRRGAGTGFEVAGDLPWTSRDSAFADLDVFNQMLAVNETVAHLEVLVQRGLAQAQERGGVLYYSE